MTVYVLNLDSTWSFPAALLEHGLDLFADGRGVELWDFTNSPVNTKLADKLAPWAESLTLSDFPGRIARLSSKFAAMRDGADPVSVLVCVDWRQVEGFANALRDKRAGNEASPGAETPGSGGIAFEDRWEPARQDRRVAQAPDEDVLKYMTEELQLVAKHVPTLWPELPVGRKLWFSLFGFMPESGADISAAYSMIDTLTGHASDRLTAFVAEHPEGRDHDKFGYLRAVIDILRNEPFPSANNQTPMDTWTHLLPVAGGTGDPKDRRQVIVLSSLETGPTYSQGLRDAIRRRIQDRRVAQDRNVTEAETLREQTKLIREEMDRIYADLDVSAGEIPARQMQALGEEDSAALQLRGNITTMIDPGSIRAATQTPASVDTWKLRLEQAFTNYFVERFKPLKRRINSRLKDGRDLDEEILGQRMASGVTEVWREDAEQLCDELKGRAFKYENLSRQNRRDAALLTLEEREDEATAETDFTAHLSNLSNWSEVETAVDRLKEALERNVRLYQLMAVLVALCFFVVLVEAISITHLTISGSADRTFLDILVSSIFAFGDLAPTASVWRLYHTISLAVILLIGCVTLGWAATVWRSISQERKALHATSERVLTRLDETAFAIERARIAAMAAGQYRILMHRAERTRDGVFSSSNFSGLVDAAGQAPASADLPKIGERLAQAFFGTQIRGFDDAHFATALDGAVNDALRGEGGHKIGELYIRTDGVDPDVPLRAGSTADRVELRLKRMSRREVGAA